MIVKLSNRAFTCNFVFSKNKLQLVKVQSNVVLQQCQLGTDNKAAYEKVPFKSRIMLFSFIG